YARAIAQHRDDSQAREFWLARFNQEIPILELPTDEPRPREWSFEGARAVHSLPTKIASDLKRLSVKHDCTLFTTVLAAWSILLGRLANQNQVIVGVPIADRAQEHGESVVGH